MVASCIEPKYDSKRSLCKIFPSKRQRLFESTNKYNNCKQSIGSLKTAPRACVRVQYTRKLPDLLYFFIEKGSVLQRDVIIVTYMQPLYFRFTSRNTQRSRGASYFSVASIHLSLC